MTAGRRTVLLGGVLLSVGLGAFLATRLDLGETARTLARLDPIYLVLPLLCALAGMPLRSWRWLATFPRAEAPTFRICFTALAAGNLMNAIIPARGGDVLRCVLVSRRSRGGGTGEALATLGIEKALDGVVLLGVLLLWLPFVTPPPWLGRLSTLAALLFGGAMAALVTLRVNAARLLARRGDASGRYAGGWPAERAADFFARFTDGLAALDSASRVGVLGALTLLVWGVEALAVWGLALALHIPLPMMAALIVTAVLALGLTVPAAPAALGTYEFFSVAGLSLFGVGAEQALALGLLMHAWSLAATAAFGIASLPLGGAEILRASKMTAGLESAGPISPQ